MEKGEWQPTATAPHDGSPVLLKYRLRGDDVHGYVPWDEIGAVIGWWDDNKWDGPGWEICFMFDGAADTHGYSSQLFQRLPDAQVEGWMPLPA